MIFIVIVGVFAGFCVRELLCVRVVCVCVLSASTAIIPLKIGRSPKKTVSKQTQMPDRWRRKTRNNGHSMALHCEKKLPQKKPVLLAKLKASQFHSLHWKQINRMEFAHQFVQFLCVYLCPSLCVGVASHHTRAGSISNWFSRFFPIFFPFISAFSSCFYYNRARLLLFLCAKSSIFCWKIAIISIIPLRA